MTREKGYYDEVAGRVVWVPLEEVLEWQARRRNNPVAPMIQVDTMDALKHPGTGVYTDSRSKFDQMSKACGLVVDTSPVKSAEEAALTNGTVRELSKEEWKDRDKDVENAFQEAHRDLVWGNQKLNEDQQQYAKQVNEQFEAATGKSSKLKGGLV